MRLVRYRAVIALDPARSAPALARQRHRHGHGHRQYGPMPLAYPRSVADTGPGAPGAVAPGVDAGEEYFSHTHELMLQAESADKPGFYRSFVAELCWDDEETPLHPGDRHVVTVTLTDDEARMFFGPGRRFTLWSGAEVGHGTISRQVFSDYGPC
jgi:hypothetical protein